MFVIPALILGLTAPFAHTAAPVDDLAAAESAFRGALQAGELADKSAALDRLVGLGDVGATPILVNEYARCTVAYHQARDAVFKLDVQIDRANQLLAEMRLRAENDESLGGTIIEHEKARGEKSTKRDREQKKLDREGPWRVSLGKGMERLFHGLGTSKRRSAEKDIWKAVDEESDPETRLASVEILGVVAGDGGAVKLQKFMGEISAQQAKLKRKLPKLMKEVREMEARMQREQEQQNGGMGRATAQQYNKIKAEAQAMRSELTVTDYICDESVRAAGRALARESEDVRSKSLDALERALKKAKGSARLRTLQIIGQVPAEQVKANLRELLTQEKDPAATAVILDDLAALGDQVIVPLLIEVYLGSESWHVQSHAAAALATLRVKEGIPALIKALETAEGRFRTDIRNSLVKLTTKDFRTNLKLWQDWWAQEGAAFEVPEAEAVVEASEQAQSEIGVTFFGISTESQRVLFVFDLSGSMEFSMVSRGAPGADDQTPPREGEISRLTAAKRDLIKAMGGLREGALFNIVLYASDVWTWQDKLVVMDTEARGEVMATIEDLTAVGGTNIYGALEEAFALAGAKDGDEWSNPDIDTIFLLTDGRPSVGVTTDPEQILAFVRDVNRNAGIVIHTIGLSGAQDAFLLRSLAEENGGDYAAR